MYLIIKVRNSTNRTWYALGGSEWTSISTDTVACTAGSEDHKITGTNTTFTSDFSVCSLIRVNDTDAEVDLLKSKAESMGARVVISKHWADGGAGAEDLAKAVVEIVDGHSGKHKYVY